MSSVTPQNNRGPQLGVVWFDLKSSIQIADTPEAFGKLCEVQRVLGLDSRILETFNPDLVVIEFDYPSRADMDRAANFKASHASIPMIIVTVQHSEALAVWCFRKKFIDFLVQPVSAGEVDACLEDVSRISKLRREQASRELALYTARVPAEISYGRGASQPLRPAIDLVAAQYHEPLTVSIAAEACQMIPFRFGRQFKETYRLDFREYVVRFRIREACRLLRNPNAQISEVAYAVGFSEPAYFTKTFKKLIGRTPSQVLGNQTLAYDFMEEMEKQDSKTSSRNS